ncbi:MULTISPECIES: nuclear transport factor 2 family protein [unclassified Streptomyces]|uniref:nuclear transport factor 2 family protein n=1 Tax=unclassified Streptomyces TaxID=2593676 RepID=UPI002E78A23F|nr:MULTISPECIES: nuclear transport factor 2 family protein [unclassified Streptomyces]MEE1764921.1 nuclear transport factor 2 family protein [Streptomyces sp. SP18BB07]MEE1831664.1 nuclear transport factor 2 family protein [Streptomyces sp. SP17KL33]
MATPHPSDPAFAEAYARAWTNDADDFVGSFAAEGTYTDVAMDATYKGHEDIRRFHRFMLRFAADSVIEFGETRSADGRLYAEWDWSGSFSGPLRLRSGRVIEPTGARFSVPGIAACAFGADGKLVSHRDYWDLTTVLDQAAAAAM